MIRLSPRISETSEDVSKNSEVPNGFTMRLGSIEEEQSPRLSSFKIGEPGIRSAIYMDHSLISRLDQVFIFLW